METQKWGHEKKSREGNASGNNHGNPSLSEDPLLSREQAVPGSAPSHAPRSPSSTAAPFLSLGTPWAAVWGGRGPVVAGNIRWRSGAPGVEKYSKTDIVLKSHLDVIISTP